MRIFISGPSGVGKSTIIAEILKSNPDFVLSISYTTRPPRPREVDGRDYFFVTNEVFEERRSETISRMGTGARNLTGPARGWRTGRGRAEHPSDIDVQGSGRLAEKLMGVYIFILPPVSRLWAPRQAGHRGRRVLAHPAEERQSELKSWTRTLPRGER